MWVAPYKFYKLTRARVWRKDYVMSGFEVTFSPVSGVTGYEEITQMFGSTGLMDYTEPFLMVDFSSYDELKYLIIYQDNESNGDNGIIGFCASNTDNDFEERTNCVGAEQDFATRTFNYLSETKTLENRLIGF